jgi:hypothetical protein
VLNIKNFVLEILCVCETQKILCFEKIKHRKNFVSEKINTEKIPFTSPKKRTIIIFASIFRSEEDSTKIFSAKFNLERFEGLDELTGDLTEAFFKTITPEEKAEYIAAILSKVNADYNVLDAHLFGFGSLTSWELGLTFRLTAFPSGKLFLEVFDSEGIE